MFQSIIARKALQFTTAALLLSSCVAPQTPKLQQPVGNSTARWPSQQRLVISISMQFETGGQPEGAESPFSGNPLPKGQPDLPAESWFRYGAREGIYRMLNLWDKHGIKVTSHVVGAAAIRYPELAKAIADRGHEIAAHGIAWSNQWDLSYDQERDFVKKGVDAVEAITGKRAVGYNCNWLRRSPNTLKILQELGFLYHIDDLSRDEPFLTPVRGKNFIVMPYTLRNNDIVAIEGKHWSPDQFLHQLKMEFNQLYAEGGTQRRMMSVSLHDRIGGTPAVVNALDAFITYAKSHEGVVFLRKDEIARLIANDPTTPVDRAESAVNETLSKANSLSVPAATKPVNVYGNPNQFTQTPLRIGQPAPELRGAEWIGPSIPTLVGRVHLVEFWATWCAPCQKSIPDLKRIARQYGDKLQVLGVTAAETEGIEPVREFVARTGITYPVAYVTDETVFEAWAHGARISGLPWVFIVDAKGNLMWWGQPFDTDFEPTLNAIINGKFDTALAQRQLDARQKLDAEGWNLDRDATQAIEENRIDDAIKLLDRLIALDPQRFWYPVERKFQLLLEKKKDVKAAYTYGHEAVRTLCRDNPHALFDIGKTILEYPEGKGRDLSLAEAALERAKALTHGENPDILRTLARLYLLRKNPKAAQLLLEQGLHYVAPGERAALESELKQARSLQH